MHVCIYLSVLAYFLYFKILETNGAGNLLICTIIIPPSSILLNAFFINEIIKIYELIGLIIITLGLIILDGRIINYIKNRVYLRLLKFLMAKDTSISSIFKAPLLILSL